jgi:hypothetical protein
MGLAIYMRSPEGDTVQTPNIGIPMSMSIKVAVLSIATIATSAAYSAEPQVRDDVKSYISSQYRNPQQRSAAMQVAKGFQNSLTVNSQDIRLVKQVDLEISRGINCVYSVFGVRSGSKPAGAVVLEIESLTTNTKERLNTYLRYNKALDGTSSSVDGDTCDK